MNTYTNVFGGENINPADLSYKAYGTSLSPLSADLELEWPFEALDGTNIVADKIDVIAGAGRSIFMPDASKASVGEDVLWNNIGASAFTVLKFDGSVIITVQPGTQWYTYLVDNSTPAGVWHTTQFGASSSSADAAALAGMGLRANVNKLDQNLLTDIARSSGDQTLTSADRAKVFRNTGGAAIYNIAAAATLGPAPLGQNGWFVVTINGGGGNVDITPTPPELIDGAVKKTLAPGESCAVYCFGTGFATMGYGRSISSSVSGISISLAGAGPTTLSAVQVGAQVQNYTGSPTAGHTVIYGPGLGYWFVWNQTSVTLNFKGDSTTDTTLSAVAAGNFSILRSLGGLLDIAFTATSGTVTSIATVPGETTGGSPVAITTTGTIGLANMPLPLVPGTYGNAGAVSQVTVDAKGRTSNVANVAVAVASSQITDLVSLIPPGTMIAYAGTTFPSSAYWLPCDGTTYLISSFPLLANRLGNTYGGDGITTFAVPNTQGRVLAGRDPSGLVLNIFGTALGAVGGSQTNNILTGHMPAHNHVADVSDPNHDHPLQMAVSGQGGTGVGALIQQAAPTLTTNGNATGIGVTTRNTGGGAPINNVQPTMLIRHLIKT